MKISGRFSAEAFRGNRAGLPSHKGTSIRSGPHARAFSFQSFIKKVIHKVVLIFYNFTIKEFEVFVEHDNTIDREISRLIPWER